MLGNQIKRQRTASGISQVDLARALGVSKQSVSNWENNNIMPSIDMLKKICQYFSCSADYLLELSENEQAILDTSNLSMEQTAHIIKLANDFSILNQRLAAAEGMCLNQMETEEDTKE